MSKKFQVIICDPPWVMRDLLKMDDVKRGAEANYNTLSIQDIKDLKVKEIADPKGCLLALWVPSSLLQEGLDVLKSYGFVHKQTYIWNKIKKEKSLSKIFKSIKDKDFKIDENILSFGMGRLFRQSHEICLIGINNNKIYKKLKNKSQRSVCFSVNKRHSEKPDNLHKSLEIMFPGDDIKFLEIFARKQRKGYYCIGNEICNGEDIRDSIKKLINEDNVKSKESLEEEKRNLIAEKKYLQDKYNKYKTHETGPDLKSVREGNARRLKNKLKIKDKIKDKENEIKKIDEELKIINK